MLPRPSNPATTQFRSHPHRGGSARACRTETPRGRAGGSLLTPLFLSVVLLSSAFGLDLTKLQPTGYVNDFAGVIDANNKALITEYCGNLERTTGAQFAVVTVPTIDDDVIETVAVDLFKQWGIGKKDGPNRDEGLLLILAIKEHKNRIEVGYGLEPIITDGYSGDTLRQIRPLLRQSAYGDALYAAVRRLGDHVMEAKGVAGQQVPIPQPQGRRSSGGGSWIPIIFIALFFLIAFAGRGGRGGGGGGGGSMLAGMILGQMLNGGRRRGGWGGGGFGGYDGGGGGGGFGGGGGGGGGFGGFGGGGSGGGGASGGW